MATTDTDDTGGRQELVASGQPAITLYGFKARPGEVKVTWSNSMIWEAE